MGFQIGMRERDRQLRHFLKRRIYHVSIWDVRGFHSLVKENMYVFPRLLMKANAKYGPIMANHQRRTDGSKFMSHHSQDLIITSLLTHHTLQMIISEIKDAIFYSVISDSTIDIVKLVRVLNDSSNSPAPLSSLLE